MRPWRRITFSRRIRRPRRLRLWGGRGWGRGLALLVCQLFQFIHSPHSFTLYSLVFQDLGRRSLTHKLTNHLSKSHSYQHRHRIYGRGAENADQCASGGLRRCFCIWSWVSVLVIFSLLFGFWGFSLFGVGFIFFVFFGRWSLGTIYMDIGYKTSLHTYLIPIDNLYT